MASFARYVLAPVAIGLLFAAGNHWDWRIGVIGWIVGMIMAVMTVEPSETGWRWPANAEPENRDD